MIKKMLTLITITCALAVTSGCNSERSTAEQNKLIAQKAFDVMNAQDFEGLREYIGDSYVRHCQATPGVVINDYDTFIKLVREWYTAFPDAIQTVHQLTAEDDFVAFYATFEGTHQAPMNGIPATGKKITSETFGYHRMEEGKIVETWVTWDNLATLTQLGVFPPPPPSPDST